MKKSWICNILTYILIRPDSHTVRVWVRPDSSGQILKHHQNIKKKLRIILLHCLKSRSYLNNKRHFTKNFLNNKKRASTHVFKWMWALFGCMDNLFKDVQIVTKDIQDLKSSLQFSQAELVEVKVKSDKMAEKHQVILESLWISSLFKQLDW